ncbi:oligoribonuclease isoform X1 [Culex pipiens pallens]|uniref:oligoribonuclease isoform X1 n=2 Tax=Culex pipiens pallens TaxID=42434 RepID=UPI0019535444|nr:oligoribonuclease isoform X1 [Culex pipiens pallens]
MGWLPLRQILGFQTRIIAHRIKMSTASPPPKPPSQHNLVWIDLEMTGLNVETDRIIEIACIVTNKNLDVLERGPDIVIHEPAQIMEAMNEWCKVNHAKTGLTQAVADSKVTLAEAEQQVLDFVKRHCPEKACPLAGNSIYMDRMFLNRYMPRLNDYLHYRIVDVSTIKEVCKRWNGSIFSHAPPKKLAHRALEDIEESIKELKYYKQYMFQGSR